MARLDAIEAAQKGIVAPLTEKELEKIEKEENPFYEEEKKEENLIKSLVQNPTTVTEYRTKFKEKRKFYFLEAPSGAIFKLQTISPEDLIGLRSNIPVNYTKLTEEPEEGKFDFEVLKERLNFLDNLICITVVEPSITENGSEDSLSLKELTPEDKLALVSKINEIHGWTREENEIVRPFRSEERVSNR